MGLKRRMLVFCIANGLPPMDFRAAAGGFSSHAGLITALSPATVSRDGVKA